MSPSPGTRIVVGMSGGVDSSVAAALLKDQGYEVIGIMLRLWSDPGTQNRCCAPDAQLEARGIAGQLEIPFYVMDAQDAFYQAVVEPFIDGYANGITPNPCLMCNRLIRWRFLLSRAKALGAEFIATGHYAKIRQLSPGKYQLLKNSDPAKDQSYFLHILSQDDLSRTIFPLADLSKPEVRQLAREYSLPVAERPDSQDLCFVGQNDYRDFLKEADRSLFQPGPILNTQGEELGQHSGLVEYTIGQRKGVGISAPEPYYVINKDLKKNTLIIGTKTETGRQRFFTHKNNWISGVVPGQPFQAAIKIRYKSREVPGLITPLGPDRAEINLNSPLPDITPGQAAVFYQDQLCLGGGIIQAEEE